MYLVKKQVRRITREMNRRITKQAVTTLSAFVEDALMTACRTWNGKSKTVDAFTLAVGIRAAARKLG